MKPSIEIIYSDDDILVINKPAGISVTADRTGMSQITDILKQQLPLKDKPLLVHRLDKHTSGVMILALTTQAQSRFSGYFAKRLIKKTYLALVQGPVPAKEGLIDIPLAPSRKDPSVLCISRKKGKQSLTSWRLLADFGSTALLAVNPLTGRMHQIRIHLQSIKLPLAIDPVYGSRQPLFLSGFKSDYRLAKGQIERPLIERLTLHAYQIQIPDSETGKPNTFIAGLDKKFSATIKMLTKYNPKHRDAFLCPADYEKIINAKILV